MKLRIKRSRIRELKYIEKIEYFLIALFYTRNIATRWRFGDHVKTRKGDIWVCEKCKQS